MSKRRNVYEYYLKPKHERYINQLGKPSLTSLLANTEYKGEQIALTTVVRCDLNSYSKWASEKNRKIQDRKDLLDDFFTHVIKQTQQFKGIYYRDEGDCVIVIFSSYFYGQYNPKGIETFCQNIVGKKYGIDGLTAKCCVAEGNVAYYQKAHETGTDEWSAEGDPFVHSHRLESVVESKPRIYFYSDMFKNKILPQIEWAPPQSNPQWIVHQDISYQIPGLSLIGGWCDITYYECDFSLQ